MDILALFQNVLTLVAATFLGALTADILISIGWAEKAAFAFIPLMRAAKLPNKLSLPVLISMIDSRAEHSIVSSLLKKSEIGEAEVLVYNLITSPLSIVLFFYRFYLPVVIVSLGPFTGGIYILFSLITSLVSFAIGLAYGRIKLKNKNPEESMFKSEGEDKIKININKSIRNAATLTKKIVQKYILILIILLVLSYFGAFSTLKSALQTVKIPLSPQALTIFTTQAISPTAGILIAGELMKAGSVGAREVLTALILGKFFYLMTQEYPRNSIPFYASMYPVKTAMKLTALSIFATLISTPLCILITLTFIN